MWLEGVGHRRSGERSDRDRRRRGQRSGRNADRQTNAGVLRYRAVGTGDEAPRHVAGEWRVALHGRHEQPRYGTEQFAEQLLLGCGTHAHGRTGRGGSVSAAASRQHRRCKHREGFLCLTH